MKRRIYNAIVLNDYPEAYYASMVEDRVKTIETRMQKFKYLGDIVICCGNKSVTKNAGKALCIVEIWKRRPMRDSDVEKACIENVPGRQAYLLRNWRYFSKKFKFSKFRVSGAYQSIFQIRIPSYVEILDDKP